MSELKYPFSGPPEAGTAIEIVPGIKWVRMPMPMKLDHINLYLLRDSDGWFVVDTGLAGEGTRQHWQRIFASELEGMPVKGVIATHMHPDHIGQVGWLTEQWQVPLWMTQAEYLSACLFSQAGGLSSSVEFLGFYQRGGVSHSELTRLQEGARGFGRMVEPLPKSYRRIQDGEELIIADQSWRILVGHGHSPEHACLYCETSGILISGDQVLPEITPNVAVNCVEPEANPLEAWQASLEKLQALPSDTLVLPAHNKPFTGLPERLQFLIDYHEQQLEMLQQACQQPRSAFELVPLMFQRELKSVELMMGLGECIAHLNCLMARGRIGRTLVDDQLYLYRALD